MQSDIVFILNFAGLSKGETVDSASVILTVIFIVSLLVEEHVKAILLVLHAPAHRCIYEFPLVEHSSVRFAPYLKKELEVALLVQIFDIRVFLSQNLTVLDFEQDRANFLRLTRVVIVSDLI